MLITRGLGLGIGIISGGFGFTAPLAAPSAVTPWVGSARFFPEVISLESREEVVLAWVEVLEKRSQLISALVSILTHEDEVVEGLVSVLVLTVQSVLGIVLTPEVEVSLAFMVEKVLEIVKEGGIELVAEKSMVIDRLYELGVEGNGNYDNA